jgi:hypothetical protein
MEEIGHVKFSMLILSKTVRPMMKLKMVDPCGLYPKNLSYFRNANGSRSGDFPDLILKLSVLWQSSSRMASMLVYGTFLNFPLEPGYIVRILPP